MPCTTDPGHYYLQKPMVSKGTAILKEGQHRSSHRLGTHKGYQALTQRIPLPVYRDNTKDKELDFINVQTGMFGINIHRARQTTIIKQIGLYSAGCTVVQSPDDFMYLLMLVKRQRAFLGTDIVSYTILLKE